tara:strand:+ start:760 stop:882 length:123 start_codon:yes stop_codon:yes gene_type:complete
MPRYYGFEALMASEYSFRMGKELIFLSNIIPLLLITVYIQ